MEPNDSQFAPYNVFEGTAWESALLKSILEDNEIEAILNDSSNHPWNAFPVRDSTVKVFVAFKDVDAAQAIVKEFTQNQQKENTPET